MTPGSLMRFGIPSLDSLLGQSERSTNPNPEVDDFGLHLPDPAARTSICLMGRQGTGKSVLALHLASRYLADSYPRDDHGCATKVLYVSTDLTFEKARHVWENFYLGCPGRRKNPFFEDYKSGSPPELGFKKLTVDKVGTLASYISDPSQPTVAFVDLADSTAGDDWGFLNRLLASLSAEEAGPRHLVVIDSIEGFETLVSECDAFGVKLSRRSRIAQLMRLSQDKCHLTFVVEGPKEEVVKPEEYITDVVIRLRAAEVNRYSRRTIEIEKVRGQTHARGQHSFTIRPGRGSTTGRGTDWYQKYFENHDDPERHREGEKQHQGYVLVFPSLHLQSRRGMERHENRPAQLIPECAGFGIPGLNEMLVRKEGLPAGTVTALIGDPGTQKTALRDSFLAECFRDLPGNVARVIDSWEKERPVMIGCEESPQKLRKWCEDLLDPKNEDGSLKPPHPKSGPRKQLVETLREVGAAVLITTQDEDARTLAIKFAKWLCSEIADPARKKTMEILLEHLLVTRIVCRRLEIHDLPSPVLIHIVQQAIQGACRRVTEQLGKCDEEDLKKRIRVVIEDFSTWKEIYPEIRSEPLFLPFLLFYLRRANVVSLLIDSHPGRPDIPIRDPFDSELRALVDHQIYTWRVPFFGESRIAIAAIPPLATDVTVEKPGSAPRSVVRELKWSLPEPGKERPEVDPHFELYTGLEEGRPQPVPLEIRLYAETPQFARYIDQENVFLEGIFTAVPDIGKVIRAVPQDAYDTLRDWFRIQPQTRLDHTLVLQVDEFWHLRRGVGIRPQWNYLNEVTCKDGETDETADPFGLFGPGLNQDYECGPGARRRVEFFEVGGYALRSQDGGACPEIDRIPFTWDFGFLMCKMGPWIAAQNMPVRLWEGLGLKEKTVKEVWRGLPKACGLGDDLNTQGYESGTGGRPSWREFLGACKLVANADYGRGSSPLVPFDVSLTTAESFACLVFEVWASEALKRFSPPQEQSFRQREWLPVEDKPPKFRLELYLAELYQAWLLLVDVLDLSRFGDPGKPFEPLTREADPNAVAARHWYKTACAAQADEPSEITVPVGLPGHFSVRGDWFLAVASASRSSRLADRALDFLCSRRGNFVRMQLGLALPTRDIALKDAKRLRTALVAPCQTEPDALNPGRVANVAYGDLRELGQVENGSNGTFSWWWRSALRDYDRVDRIWQKSLVRMAIAWSDFRRECGDRWVPGFEMYDRLQHYRIRQPGSYQEAKNIRLWLDVTRWEDEDSKGLEQFKRSWDKFVNMCTLTESLFQQAMD